MCIINHTHRFVFVHVPKNAGTAVSHHLSALSSYRDQEIGFHRAAREAERLYAERFGLQKHSTARQIRAVMGEEDFEAYRVIGVARDPYDRVRSLFRFLHQWPAWKTLPKWVEHVEAFERMDDINEFVVSPMFARHGPGNLFRPQANWLADRDAEALMVDVLLRFETLDDDLARLPEVLGLPPGLLPERLQPRNVTVVDKAVTLDATSRALIDERYAADFRLLGYEREASGPSSAVDPAG